MATRSPTPCRRSAASAPTVQSVVDSAGYGPRVAPGSLATIFGTNLASGTVSAAALPLPATLGGTTLTVGGVAAHLLYVSPGQINFQVPSATKSGTAAVVVNGPGGASASFSCTVTSSAPAIYQYGMNHAVAQSGSTLNSDSAAAATPPAPPRPPPPPPRAGATAPPTTSSRTNKIQD